MLAKVEYLNPGGSVKDRIAVKMIEAAERDGKLKPGGTIVEPTSGNTGVGLAIVAQAKGYHCVFVCPDKVSEDKRNVLAAYGAEVVVCPTAVEPEHPDSYYSVSDRLVREIDGCLEARPVLQPEQPASHYESTGPEIWAADRRADHPLRRRHRHRRHDQRRRPLPQGGLRAVGSRSIGADPSGSVYSGGDGRPYLVEGVGEDFWPANYDRTRLRPGDRGLRRRLLRHDPPAGPGGGPAGRRLVRDGGGSRDPARPHELDDPDAVIVVLLPDSGRGYLTKVFSDAWLTRYGFAAAPGKAVRVVGDVLREKSGEPAVAWCTPIPDETIAEAVEILREYGVSQMPVVRAEPPVMAAEVVGSVSERGLLGALFGQRVRPADAGRGGDGAAAADARRDRARGQGRRRCSWTAMRCWCWTTASRSGC